VPGALCILIGRMAFQGNLGPESGSALSWIFTFLGFSGFLIPIVYEWYLPIELLGRPSWEINKN
jgi:hypothetical protein